MMEMTYDEAKAYCARIAGKGSVLGLESIENLMQELSNVQEKLSVIHIAGTNGKGSVGAYLAAVLREAGYVVGRYTSPAVFDPLEVWQVDGCNITQEEYAALVSQVKCACDAMTEKGMSQPTLFEVETAVAFLFFYQKKCDYVLLETGMGGELDATNILTHPVCAVITSISMDHMKFLGNTLGEIARAKAGIIKADSPVVTICQKPEAMEVITKVAEEKQAPLFVADRAQIRELVTSPEGCSYDCPGIGTISTSMTGLYQVDNSLLAAVVLKEVLHLSPEIIKAGIQKARWSGRFEIIAKEPLFIIDGAHNEDAAEKLYATLQNYFTNRRITYIIGVLADKEYEKILKIMLPAAERVYTVTPKNPRALAAEALAGTAENILAGYHSAEKVSVMACSSVEEAVETAQKQAGRDEIVLAFGSLSYLAEVRQAVSVNNE